MLTLLFQIGPDRYALDSENIIEVFPKIKLKQLPRTEDYVAGLINYGGIPVPVIDLPQLVTKRASSSAMHTRIILLQYTLADIGTHLLGVIAEKVTETKEMEKTSFKDSGIKVKDLPFLGGIYTEGETAIQLFKTDELFKYLKDILS